VHQFPDGAIMTARVTISLPDDLLAQLDSVAEAESLTRSDVVREAAGHYLASRASGTEAARRLQAVEDGVAWLTQVAEQPSADPRPSLEILHGIRGDSIGDQSAAGTTADSKTGE
jgi:predicted transcriptional regulator